MQVQAGAGTGQERSRQQLALLRWALLLLIQPVCVVQTHPPAPAKFQVGVSRRAAAPSCWHVETRACCAYRLPRQAAAILTRAQVIIGTSFVGGTGCPIVINVTRGLAPHSADRFFVMS